MDAMDCGPTCLRMVAKYYGKHFSLQKLREYSYITREGVSLKGINDAAVKIGFSTLASKLSFEQLDEEAPLPCILLWNQQHFVVLPPQNYNKNKKGEKIIIADPVHGLVKLDKQTFLSSWVTSDDGKGIALLLETTPSFFDLEEERKQTKGIYFLLDYLKPYRKYTGQLLLGMLVASLFSLIAPFLMQGMVDYGINQQNIEFIYLLLLAQIALFIGNTTIEAIRGWILLHVSSRVNISIISDFLIKLMKLPIRFFDTKMVGDITQRISDHNRIEQFLTGSSLTTLFSILNLIVFAVVLGIYSIPILMIFFVGSMLAVGWMLFFLKKRRDLDYERFQKMSDNQNSLFEIITGMQEIKMNDSETSHRWGWQRIQAKLFHINVKGLTLTQYQNIGSSFLNQLKNLLISFVAAKQVLHGEITLGMMLSVSYITGQMNSPIEQLLQFFRAAQDAKISVERLSDIHDIENEEKEGELKPAHEIENALSPKIDGKAYLQSQGIVLKNVSFQYSGPSSPKVLDDINLTIPYGKITALVGASGSGKTTLMKLLLKFYDPTGGTLYLGSTPFNLVSAKWWRNHCGVVMSDGFIFSSTIARNISVQEETDQKRLLSAVKTANIESFIFDLPLGFSTKIGNTGNGISSGQKQRILIARAVYKEPDFLFLDEATSTLDANNERQIIENLNQFFEGRTVVVIAHRLSTVKHADQIVVMDEGRIAEVGDHESLINIKGKYFDLIKNQLELGN